MDPLINGIKIKIEKSTDCPPAISQSIAIGIVAALQDPAIIDLLKETLKD